MTKTSLALTFLFAVQLSPAADFPSAEIKNEQIKAKIYLPDAKTGFYRSTRFDWSGVVGSLEYKGHNYYGPWFKKITDVYDFGYEGDDVTSAPFTAMIGPGEEYQTDGKALGYDEAKAGGTFIKIGVGALRKPDDSNYDHSKAYEIVDGGKWTVKKNRDSVEFTQELNDSSSKYGYVYKKAIRLVKGKPEMVIEHSLKNTGAKPIRSNMYNHNFLTLDNQPPGPDFTITFPFELKPRRAPNKDLGEVRGNQILYTKTLADKDRMTTSAQGFSDSPKDYDIRVENKKVGAGVRITGDKPLSNVNYWSIKTVLAVEPFIAMNIEPGNEFSWKISYEYYTLPANAK
jgi:hypothetical protein